MNRIILSAAVALSAGFAVVAAPAVAGEIRIACYSDGNECPATIELAKRFMAANPDVKVVIDEMPYKAILESLPVQLAAGQGPDAARVTLFGTVMKYMMDLTPYVKNPAYWEQSFGAVLPWTRPPGVSTGIYGLPTQFTVTSPLVNKTLFDQAGVQLPADGASWDEWAKAVSAVAKATKTPYGMAFDRSGHRFAAAAIGMGAQYFAADGTPAVVDEGFKAMASRFVAWNADNTVEKDVWAATGGGYRDAFEEFANGKIVMYHSGSWQLTRLQKQIGDAFDWRVVGNPCDKVCSGMPGGAAFVAFKESKNPKDLGRFFDFLAEKPVYAEWMGMTSNIPAHAELQKGGVAYKLSAPAVAAMGVFGANASKISPVAYKLSGYAGNSSIYNPTVDRLSQVIAGQMTLDQAYGRITQDVADALAAAKK
jgi:alpha-1,4-digalacturonate transport system substrate-binding protein